MTRTAPLVRVHQLGVSLQGQTVLQDISFESAPGEIITVIGPNAAGKTTLIRAVLGLQRPDTGTLERRDGLRIGYMPHKRFIDPTMPVPVGRYLTLTQRKPNQQADVLDLT